VSAMSKNFVSDPRSVVKSGDVVRVKVLSVDVPRHRISLTLRLDDEGPPPQAARRAQPPAGGRDRAQDRSSANSGRTERGARPRPRASGSGGPQPPEAQGALADALRRAGLVPGTPKRPPTGSIG
jgi:uncharacterized protein